MTNYDVFLILLKNGFYLFLFFINYYSKLSVLWLRCLFEFDLELSMWFFTSIDRFIASVSFLISNDFYIFFLFLMFNYFPLLKLVLIRLLIRWFVGVNNEDIWYLRIYFIVYIILNQTASIWLLQIYYYIWVQDFN